MFSSSVRAFTDPDEYAAALRQGTVELTVTRRGRFAAKLCTVGFQHLSMQRLSEELPRFSHVDGHSGRAFMVFRTSPGPSVVRNGIELSTTSITRLRPGQSYYQNTSGPTSHGGMSLPVDEMVAVGGAMAGRDLVPPHDDITVVPPPNTIARLQRLHKTAGDLAEHAPATLAHPEAARALEQALIDAMIACLGCGEVTEDRAAKRQHAAIMRRFHRVVEEHLDEPLYVPELCREIGASVRTLNTCWQEHLGMGPKHYLLLRRMHMVRRALRQSAPADTTVTEVSTRYGFWQLGRLAVEYRALFGETPSTTLARRRERVCRDRIDEVDHTGSGNGETFGRRNRSTNQELLVEQGRTFGCSGSTGSGIVPREFSALCQSG
jgi:AraC-like DNA-binding protein